MSSPQETDTTIDIETAGGSASVKMGGATLASIHIRGDAAASYRIDVKTRDGSWITDVGPSYSGSSNYDDDVQTGMQFLRVWCTSGTGGSGDEATITIGAGG